MIPDPMILLLLPLVMKLRVEDIASTPVMAPFYCAVAACTGQGRQWEGLRQGRALIVCTVGTKIIADPENVSRNECLKND